jgi:hypothetical protein
MSRTIFSPFGDKMGLEEYQDLFSDAQKGMKS